MADVKISALPLATTPLAGTEVLPIVQSATTDQVTVANLTAGRSISAAALTLTTTPLAAGSGGTGLTSFTSGYIPYANSSTSLSFGSNLISNGLSIGLGVTLSTWDTGVAALQSTYGVIAGNSQINIMQNANYVNGWVYTSTGAATQYQQIVGLHIWNYAASGTAGNPITFSEAMRIDNSGNVGIGTSSPNQRLDIKSGGIGLEINPNNSGSVFQAAFNRNTTDFVPLTYQGSYVSFNTGALATNTERARIDSSGNLLVGTTSAAYTEKFNSTQSDNGKSIVARCSNASQTDSVLQVYADRNTTGGTFSAINYYNLGAAATRFYVTDGGVIYATSATVNVISDARLKENIRDLDTGLSDILKLRPRRFDWKDNQGDGKKNVPGFIAQEVENSMSELVVPWNITGKDDDDHKGLATGNLIPTLVKAIQELAAKVAELEAKI